MLPKAFNLGNPGLVLFLPLPDTSFSGRRRVLSGAVIFCRSSLVLSDALRDASFICRFERAVSASIFAVRVCSALSSDPSSRSSLSAYDVSCFFRGELRSLVVDT